MDEFSKLARRQAGGISIKLAVSAAALSGAVVFGVLEWQDHELVAELGQKAHAMASDLSTIGAIRSYFSDEAGRLESYHAKNAQTFSSASELTPFLAVLPSSPTLEALRQDEATQYAQAKASLATERAAAESVWNALSHPQEPSALKQGLTAKNLEIYSSAKDCALRGAGEGAYCGPAAAVGVRAQTAIAQASELQSQSEAFGRQSLATGWDDWDGAKDALTRQANAEIDQAQAQAKQSFDRGDIDKDDWDSLNAGFAASRSAASEQIALDGQQLRERTSSGHLTSFDWYLLSRWASSSSSTTQVHVISHPYLAGGAAYVNPSSALARSTPSQGPTVQVRPAGSANFAQAQAPQVAAPAARLAGMENANAAARAGLAAQTAPAGAKAAPPNSAYGGRSGEAMGAMPARFSPPAGANPYSVNSSTTPFGSKVSASFARAAGPRLASAIGGTSSTSRGGISGKVSSFSSARSASIHSASAHGGEGGHGSVGHASVGGHGSAGG